MAFCGYFMFGGTELVNSERTRAYVRAGLPTFGLTNECCTCEDLGEIVGDGTYTSPTADPAPWYSPYTPGSGEFYGFLPLSVEGIDDGTIGATITELTTDGAVISRPRRSSRAVRFSGLLVGASDKGLDLGMAWLKSVLQGSECSDGDCGGDDLCYLAACPQVVSYADAPVVVLDQPYGDGHQWTTTKGWVPEAGSTVSTVAGFEYLRMGNPSGSGAVASVMLSDLVPGSWYRVQVSFAFGSTGGPVRLEVIGATAGEYRMFFADTDRPSQYPAPDDGGIGVYEFQAAGTEHLLQVTGPRSTANLDLFSARVERVPRQGLVLTNQASLEQPAQVGAWTPGYTSGAFYAPYASGFPYAISGLTSSNPGTFAAGNPWISRSMAGLTPGRRYTLTVAVRTRSAQINQVPVVDRGARVTLDTGQTTNTPVLWRYYPGGAWTEYNGWFQFEFVATSNSHTVTVAPDAAYTVPAGGYDTWVRIDYLRVEEDLTLVPFTDPDPALDLRRYLHNVTAYSGPTVTGEFAPQVGAMRQVEFLLVAGDPRPLGEPRAVAGILGSGVEVVPDMACSQGEPVLTNWVAMPSFRVTPTFWSVFPVGAASLASVGPVTDAFSGDYVGRLTMTNVSPTTYVDVYTDDDLPLVVGATYTASIYVRSALDLKLSLYPMFGNVMGPTGSADVVPGGGWVRVHTTYTVPNGATTVTLRMRISRTALLTSGNVIDLDAAMVVDGARLGPYFDGDSQYGSWTGIADRTPSVWRRDAAPLVVDPDCPPLPAPPRPPLIPTDCIEAPSTWRRYTAAIPSQVTAVSPVSLPAVSMTTGGSPARGVRVRFTPNPLGLSPEMLDPCTYCGEFIVSYLPANTTLSVDAAGRTVEMTIAGQQPQSAMHLLYGTDGGPVTWPELSCGIEYLAIVDLDADTPAPLVDMQLSVTPAY